jgi:hypothetical protein
MERRTNIALTIVQNAEKNYNAQNHQKEQDQSKDLKNLTEEERNLRLGVAIGMGIGSAAIYFFSQYQELAYLLTALAAMYVIFYILEYSPIKAITDRLL